MTGENGEFVRETTETRFCNGCGEDTIKRVNIDVYHDIYLTCEECLYTEMYDGEPLTMLQSGQFR